MLRWISALVLGSTLVGGALTPSTAQAGQWQSQNGYSYYRGDDGRWYYTDSAGQCYVWDGVAWQPCAPPDGGYVAPYGADGYPDDGYRSPYDYGYSYGYAPYGYAPYGYAPYRSHVYVAPFGGHHDHFRANFPSAHVHVPSAHVHVA